MNGNCLCVTGMVYRVGLVLTIVFLSWCPVGRPFPGSFVREAGRSICRPVKLWQAKACPTFVRVLLSHESIGSHDRSMAWSRCYPWGLFRSVLFDNLKTVALIVTARWTKPISVRIHSTERTQIGLLAAT